MCLVVDLCTESEAQSDADVPGPNCHAASDDHRTGAPADGEATASRLASSSKDECCSVRAEQIEVKVGRESRSSGRPPLAVAGRGLGVASEGTPRAAAHTAVSPRLGPSPPVYTLHAALLL